MTCGLTEQEEHQNLHNHKAGDWVIMARQHTLPAVAKKYPKIGEVVKIVAINGDRLTTYEYCDGNPRAFQDTCFVGRFDPLPNVLKPGMKVRVTRPAPGNVEVGEVFVIDRCKGVLGGEEFVTARREKDNSTFTWYYWRFEPIMLSAEERFRALGADTATPVAATPLHRNPEFRFRYRKGCGHRVINEEIAKRVVERMWNEIPASLYDAIKKELNTYKGEFNKTK